MNQQERLRAQREGGQVRRAHTTPHIGHYDNAQHSFNMLLLLYELHPDPSLELSKAIAYHDLAERYMGDIPAPALLEYPEIRDGIKQVEKEVAALMGLEIQISDDDKRWLASLDKLEHWLWCQDQLALGNQNVRAHIAKLDQIFFDLAKQGQMPIQVVDFLAKFTWKRGTDGVPESSAAVGSDG